MLRPDSSHQPRTVSDTELGLAAFLLLVVMVLTALIVPVLA
jgi:hypothetical protein